MARAHRVDNSRKEHTCSAGGHPIPAGESYYWAAPGYRAAKRYRCLRHPFRPSELTTSLASEALAAQEALEDALDAIDPSSTDALDDITAAVENLAADLRQYADTRQEALDAWENGNSQLEDLLNIAEDAANEAETFEVEEWSGDADDRDRGLDGDGHDEAMDAAEEWRAHVQDQIDRARDLAALEV